MRSFTLGIISVGTHLGSRKSAFRTHFSVKYSLFPLQEFSLPSPHGPNMKLGTVHMQCLPGRVEYLNAFCQSSDQVMKLSWMMGKPLNILIE